MSNPTALKKAGAWHDTREEMPDADMTVLVHCPPSDDPVWLGYFDGETWRNVAGEDLGAEFVTHWMDLPEPPTA